MRSTPFFGVPLTQREELLSFELMKRECDTNDWSNGCFGITGINEILNHINIEMVI